MARGCAAEWVLEGMDKPILKQFLKAGFVYKRELFPTEDGSPQGGVMSQILANLALDGMEKALSDRFHTNRDGDIDTRIKGQFGAIRR